MIISKDTFIKAECIPAFKDVLLIIREAEKKQDYDLRNRAIIEAVYMALFIGHDAGVRFDPAEPEWPVFFIELPTGQVSWHLPQHVKTWDGHSTEEKYARLVMYVDGV